MMVGTGLIAAGMTALVVLALLMVGFVIAARRASASQSSPPFNPGEAAPSTLSSPVVSSAASGLGFRMTIADVFSIKGRGLVVTGRVEDGSLARGQRVLIASIDGVERHETQVTGIEAFHKVLEAAQTGDNVGLLLAGNLTKNEIRQGMIVTSA